MLTKHEEVLLSLKTAVENDERKLKESSAKMIKYFVESIEHCKEVYASIPASQVPVQEAIDAVNELGLVVGIHGKSNNYIKDWNSVTLGKKENFKKLLRLYQNPGMTRSEVAKHIGVSSITATKRLEDLIGFNKVRQGEKEVICQGRPSFVYYAMK